MAIDVTCTVSHKIFMSLQSCYMGLTCILLPYCWVYTVSHTYSKKWRMLWKDCATSSHPASLVRYIGATKLVADMIVSSEHYCYTVVHSSFPFLSLLSPSSLPPLSLHFSLPSPNIHTHIHTVRLTCSAILPTGLGSSPEWICKYIKHLTHRLYIGHFSCGL